jgi:hypothetical protein
MKYEYIKFSLPVSKVSGGNGLIFIRFCMRFIVKVMYLIFPVAKIDFEGLINKVNFWLLEIDRHTELPNREIGLDENGKVLVAMPLGKNYGYWTDNNMTIKDLKSQFKVEKCEENEFEKLWNDFIRIHNIKS